MTTGATPTLKRLLVGTVVSLALAGCTQHYWTRSQATPAEFTADHHECLAKNSELLTGNHDRGVPTEQAFRRCLIAKGWVRQELQQVPHGGYFRGYEDPAQPGAVNLSQVPVQPDTATLDPSDPRYSVGPDGSKAGEEVSPKAFGRSHR